MLSGFATVICAKRASMLGQLRGGQGRDMDMGYLLLD